MFAMLLLSSDIYIYIYIYAGLGKLLLKSSLATVTSYSDHVAGCGRISNYFPKCTSTKADKISSGSRKGLLLCRDVVIGIQEGAADHEEVVGALLVRGGHVADRAVERAAGADPEPARLVDHLNDVLQFAGGDASSATGTALSRNLVHFHCPMMLAYLAN